MRYIWCSRPPNSERDITDTQSRYANRKSYITLNCRRAFQMWRITDIDKKVSFTNVEIIPLSVLRYFMLRPLVLVSRSFVLLSFSLFRLNSSQRGTVAFSDLTTATSTTTPQINDLIGRMKKSIRSARAARFLVQYFDVVCQTTTWNVHIWGSDDNAGSQQQIFHSLPLHENHSYQASKSAVRLFCTTWSTWNNRKRLKLTQSSILMWRFRCSCRRSSLNSQIFVIVWCSIWWVGTFHWPPVHGLPQMDYRNGLPESTAQWTT